LKLSWRRNGFEFARNLEYAVFLVGNIKMAIQSESVAQKRAATSDDDQLESAGQAILKLLHKAAGATEANSRQALATAQKLASQLRAAEDRIAELEAEVQHYRGKSERAEDWLHKISAEIEDRLFNESVEKRREVSRRP
jgi:cell fate (sporulation/competence/biofilm development) regulator YmcA (YheA/YmcA/DUF963 family)